jgi:hypothetical protein
MITRNDARWGCLTAISVLRSIRAGHARLVPDAGRQSEIGAAQSFAGA